MSGVLFSLGMRAISQFDKLIKSAPKVVGRAALMLLVALVLPLPKVFLLLASTDTPAASAIAAPVIALLTWFQVWLIRRILTGCNSARWMLVILFVGGSQRFIRNLPDNVQGNPIFAILLGLSYALWLTALVLLFTSSARYWFKHGTAIPPPIISESPNRNPFR